MRIGLTLLLALHGVIHFAGFLKWSALAPVEQLSGRTFFSLSQVGSRVFALLWLIATLVLLGAAALRATRHEVWWLPALGGVLLSQCLIVVAWPDAKVGTVANVLLLAATVVAGAQARFDRQIRSEARALFAQSFSSRSSVVRLEELRNLPGPVRRWLATAGVIGRDRARTVRLKQRGELRTAPDSAWMPALAEQYFSIDPPAFVWSVDTKMLGVPIRGRDKYVDGKGQMLIKAASLVSIVDVADEKIDHGAMLRFLGEIVWFPSAALSRRIEWEPVDATNAKATMRDAGTVVSAVFSFDDRGRVVGMRADRYLGGGLSAKLKPWVVSCSEWRTFRGVEVPSRGEVAWKLEGGDFTYYRWEIVDVEFNRAELFRKGAAPEDATDRLAAREARAAR